MWAVCITAIPMIVDVTIFLKYMSSIYHWRLFWFNTINAGLANTALAGAVAVPPTNVHAPAAVVLLVVTSELERKLLLASYHLTRTPAEPPAVGAAYTKPSM